MTAIASTTPVCVSVVTMPRTTACQIVPRSPTRYAATSVLPCPGVKRMGGAEDEGHQHGQPESVVRIPDQPKQPLDRGVPLRVACRLQVAGSESVGGSGTGAAAVRSIPKYDPYFRAQFIIVARLALQGRAFLGRHHPAKSCS